MATTPQLARGATRASLCARSDELRTPSGTMPNDATERVRKDWDSQASQWYEQREVAVRRIAPDSRMDGQPLAPVKANACWRLPLVRATRDSSSLRCSAADVSSRPTCPLRWSMRRGNAAPSSESRTRTTGRSMRRRWTSADASFDGVICRWGFMLMPDPVAALRECRRILVPGGRLVFAVFTGPEKNPFASVPARILIEMGHLPPPSSAWQPGILALADRTRLESLLHEAGFASPRHRGRRHDVDVRRYRCLLEISHRPHGARSAGSVLCQTTPGANSVTA